MVGSIAAREWVSHRQHPHDDNSTLTILTLGDTPMYDPSTGRWSIEDPIGFDAGDMDLYRYVGNNPTNAVDPSGLMEGVSEIRFTWYGFTDDQRKQLMANTQEAIVKLEKALAMLTKYWDELKDLASFMPPGATKIVIDRSYTKLREEILVTTSGLWILPDIKSYVSPRKVYTDKIRTIFQQINSCQHLEFTEDTSAPTENGREAYVRYFFDPTGERIHITKLYWERMQDRQVDIIVRELGRREWFDETNTGNVLRDAAEWQAIIDYLARKYDEMMAKQGKK